MYNYKEKPIKQEENGYKRNKDTGGKRIIKGIRIQEEKGYKRNKETGGKRIHEEHGYNMNKDTGRKEYMRNTDTKIQEEQ